MSTAHPAGEWALRTAGPADVPALAAAELLLFPDEAWSGAQLAAEVSHPDRRYVLVTADPGGPGAPTRTGPLGAAPISLEPRLPGGESLAGYAGIMLLGEDAELQTIGTSRPGRGIGRALLTWAEQRAREGGATRMLLEVREDNARARAVYTAAGYREIGRRRGYYRIRGRRIDAMVMERDLTA